MSASSVRKCEQAAHVCAQNFSYPSQTNCGCRLTFRQHWYPGSLVPAPTIREKTATAFHREGSAGPSTAAPSTGAPKTAASSNGASARGGFRPPKDERLDLSDEVISCGVEQSAKLELSLKLHPKSCFRNLNHTP